MTIQQYETFEPGSARSIATSKLVKAWESKNTKRAAKASGATLMAISLSACNGSGEIDTSSDVNLEVDAGSSNADNTTTVLTSSTDSKNGTSGDDTFTAGLVYTPGGNDRVNSLQTEDAIDGGEGTDTLNITLGNAGDNGGGEIAPILTDVEIVNVAFTSEQANYNQSTRTDELNLEFSNGTDVVNVTRIIGDDANTYYVVGMESSTDELSVSGAPNDANVEFNYREGALEDDAETLNLDLSGVRLSNLDITLGNRSDQDEDGEGSFEFVNITTGGNYANVDTFKFNVDGDNSDYDALSQDVTLTLGVDTEFNDFDMDGADSLSISLGANDLAITQDETDNEDELVDANGDAVFGLDFEDGAFDTENLNELTITGSGDALLNGVGGEISQQDYDDNSDNEDDDSFSERYEENDTGLIVDASAMTGDLHISVTDNVAEDDDSKVLSGDGDDVVLVDDTMMMDVDTGAGNDLVSTNGSDLGATASVITGAGDDVVSVADMEAFGDSGSINGGRDEEASIVTGAGNDTVTVEDMENAISWEDNQTAADDNVADDNADDTYVVNGTSIDTGAGDDAVTVESMAEGTTVNTGDGDDTFTFSDGTAADYMTFMESDTDDDNELISNDGVAQDFTGASVDLGAGDDHIVYIQQDDVTGEDNWGEDSFVETTILDEGSVTNVGLDGVRGGAVIDAGDGDDTMTISANDLVEVTEQTNFDDHDGEGVADADEQDLQIQVKGVETLNLHTQNIVTQERAEATGAVRNSDDSNAVVIQTDLLRFDDNLSTINLFDDGDILPTENNDELFNAETVYSVFDLENVDSGDEVNLTAREANGVVDGEAVDNLEEDVHLHVSVADASGFDTSFELNMIGDARNAGGDFDISLEMSAEETDRTDDSAVDTDDDAGLTENVTLNITTATSHGIDMASFGDVENSNDTTDAVFTGVADTSLTITGSAAGELVAVDNVHAATITADIAADVDLTVDDANHYHITTGSGDDIIDVRADNVQVDRSNTDDVDETDTIDAGAGRDTLIINDSDDFGDDVSSARGTIDDDDDWTSITSVEDLVIHVDGDHNMMFSEDAFYEAMYGEDVIDDERVLDGDSNLAGQMIVLDEDALEAGVQTITTVSDGDDLLSLRVTLGDDFATSGFTGSALGHDFNDHMVIDLSGHAGATYLRLDNFDDDTLEETSNVAVALNATNNAVLDAISLGDDRVNNTVIVAVSDKVDTDTVISSDEQLDNTFGVAGAGDDIVSLGVGALNEDVNDSVSGDIDEGHYDELIIVDAVDTVADEATEDSVIVLVDNDWIADDATFTIDASGLTADAGILVTSADENQAGFDITGVNQVLDITGSQGDDMITGGDAEDIISGQAGDDLIQGEHVRVDLDQKTEMTFADQYQEGDTVEFTINGSIVTMTVDLDGTDQSGVNMAAAVASVIDTGSDTTGVEGITASIAGDAIDADFTATSTEGSNVVAIKNLVGVAYTASVSAGDDQNFVQTVEFNAGNTSGEDQVDWNVVYDDQTYTVSGTVDTNVFVLEDFADLEAAVENDGNVFESLVDGGGFTITNASGTAIEEVTSVVVDEDSKADGTSSSFSIDSIGGEEQGEPSIEFTQLITDNTVYAADELTGDAGDDTFAIYKSGQLDGGEHINIDHITDMNFGDDDGTVDTILFGDFYNVEAGFVETYTTGINDIVNQNDADGETIVIELSGSTFEQAVADLFDTQGVFTEGDDNEANSAGLFSYEDRDYVIAVGDTAGEFGADDFIVDVTGYTGILSADDLNLSVDPV